MALYDPGKFPTDAQKVACPVADKLDEARALIERGWCQNLYAKDANGNCVDPLDDRAANFCMIGAVSAVTGKNYRACLRTPELAALASAVDGAIAECVSGWNDANGRTQAEVIDAFKRAAEIARETV